MLIIFKSKVGADIIMFEENAKQILDLLGKDIKQGIITAEQSRSAITILEKEIERQKIIEAKEKAERARLEKEEQERKEKDPDDDKDKDVFGDQKKQPQKPELPISFSARTYPFMAMLKAAQKKKKDIVWGV